MDKETVIRLYTNKEIHIIKIAGWATKVDFRTINIDGNDITFDCDFDFNCGYTGE